jgi:hypothetical protein
MVTRQGEMGGAEHFKHIGRVGKWNVRSQKHELTLRTEIKTLKRRPLVSLITSGWLFKMKHRRKKEENK